MEKAADPGAISGDAPGGYGVCLQRFALRRARGGPVPLRRLRQRAFRLRDKIRFRNGLAELLEAPCSGECPRENRRELRGRPARSEVHAVRRAPRPRVHRWAGSNRPAVLREFRGAALPPAKKSLKKQRDPERARDARLYCFTSTGKPS